MESKHLRGATGRTGVGGEDPRRDQDPQKTVPSEQGEQAKRHRNPGRPSRISSLQGILVCGGMGMKPPNEKTKPKSLRHARLDGDLTLLTCSKVPKHKVTLASLTKDTRTRPATRESVFRQIRGVTREENQANRWERKNNSMGEEKQEKRKNTTEIRKQHRLKKIS